MKTSVSGLPNHLPCIYHLPCVRFAIWGLKSQMQKMRAFLPSHIETVDADSPSYPRPACPPCRDRCARAPPNMAGKPCPCGVIAKDRLGREIKGAEVQCTVAIDRQRRAVASCTANGKGLSEIMHLKRQRIAGTQYSHAVARQKRRVTRKCRHGRHNSHWTGRIGCTGSPAPHPAPSAVRAQTPPLSSS
jgi:hypothetical protein